MFFLFSFQAEEYEERISVSSKMRSSGKPPRPKFPASKQEMRDVAILIGRSLSSSLQMGEGLKVYTASFLSTAEIT